ncbi:friend leukemia integration 1 transcription factor [Plakobranchus ocellatus]|uniref:Friend leukemia integration 1 transcription factor n=1 Tax=Plakobranchus ocellatus TaxID=259542 RepID=A0AAV4AE42_9GAST|nr:friend leukemia integration 1 transcription factor [Plakobranchus ocellatus]
MANAACTFTIEKSSENDDVIENNECEGGKTNVEVPGHSYTLPIEMTMNDPARPEISSGDDMGHDNVPVFHVDLAKGEANSLHRKKSEESTTQNSNAINKVCDIETNLSNEKNNGLSINSSVAISVSVSPTPSFLNYLSSMSNNEDDGLQMDVTISPDSPSSGSILENRSYLKNAVCRVNSDTSKTNFKNLKRFSIEDAVLGSSYFADLSAKKDTGKSIENERFSASKTTPYTLNNQKKPKLHDYPQSVDTLVPQSNSSNQHCSLFASENQSLYGPKSLEDLPSCRFENVKQNSLSTKETESSRGECGICESHENNDLENNVILSESHDILSFPNPTKLQCLEKSATKAISTCTQSNTFMKRENNSNIYAKIWSKDRHCNLRTSQASCKLSTSSYHKSSFLWPNKSLAIADNDSMEILTSTSINDQSETLNGSLLPSMCRYPFPCDEDEQITTKNSSPRNISKGDFMDKEGLSKYLCDDEPAVAKNDLSSTLCDNVCDNISSVINANIIDGRRGSNISNSNNANISNTCDSNSNNNITKNVSKNPTLSNQPGPRRSSSSHMETSTGFADVQPYSQTVQDKSLTSPLMSDLGLDTNSLVGQSYLCSALAQAGNDLSEHGTVMNSSSSLEMASPSSSSCLYATDANNNGRMRKEDAIVPAEVNAWTPEHVQIWLRWTVAQFALTEVDFGHFEGIDGSGLCRMTWEDMASRAGSHNAQVLFGYLSFLKKANTHPGYQTNRYPPNSSSTDRSSSSLQTFAAQHPLTSNFETPGFTSAVAGESLFYYFGFA